MRGGYIVFEKLDKKKLTLDSYRPFAREVLNNLKSYFDVEFTYNSNAIEGNTLTLTETKLIIEEGITVGRGKTLREHLDAINQQEAIGYLEELVQKNAKLSEAIIRNIHYLILKSIDDKSAGVYRNTNVRISGSKHRPPEHILVTEKMKELVQWYEDNKSAMHPIELAARFHHQFVYIHPFNDGNGRTARLLMNLILMQSGYPLTIIRMEDRLDYMEALEKASIDNDYSDFTKLVAQAVERSLDSYLEIVANPRD